MDYDDIINAINAATKSVCILREGRIHAYPEDLDYIDPYVLIEELKRLRDGAEI